jgi:hypothetical protein
LFFLFVEASRCVSGLDSGIAKLTIRPALSQIKKKHKPMNKPNRGKKGERKKMAQRVVMWCDVV